MIRKWPDRHPKHDVQATDLRGLEDHLISRSGVNDGDPFGIDRISNWWQPIQIHWSDDWQTTITIRNLPYVTPRGQPVWVGPRPANPIIRVESSTSTLRWPRKGCSPNPMPLRACLWGVVSWRIRWFSEYTWRCLLPIERRPVMMRVERPSEGL